MSFYNRVTLHTKHAFALKNQIFKVECIASFALKFAYCARDVYRVQAQGKRPTRTF